MTPLGTLLDMLTYRRPMGTLTEARFIQQFIMPLGAQLDAYGNYHVHVTHADGSPSRVVWSCHTDTVHRTADRQTVKYDPVTGLVCLSKRSIRHGSNCLGADDTAGVFLCVNMIQAQVPGHYIFHYGEERGGQGSSALAHHDPDLISHADIAIALDRRGTGDVITHQWSTRTCSETFAWSLAHALMTANPALTYAPTTGIYTDTAEYAGIIGECTNLSVGYANEHREIETLNTIHVMRLLEALCKLDQAALVAVRIPSDAWETQSFAFTSDADYHADLDPHMDDLCVCGHTANAHDTAETECTLCLCEMFENADSERLDLYLDPEHANIQRALRKAQDDLTAQTADNYCVTCGKSWRGNKPHACSSKSIVIPWRLS